MRLTETIVLSRKRRWFVWRDVVALLLVLAVVLLVRQVGDLQHQLEATNAKRTQQFADVTQELQRLRLQLGVKDARIRQLTDQLLKAGITPAPAPAPPSPSASPRPSLTPQPRPTPTRRPSPQPTRTVHPTSCTVPIPTCLPTPLRQFLLALRPFRLLQLGGTSDRLRGQLREHAALAAWRHLRLRR